MKKINTFFSQQPFWEVMKKRENGFICAEDCVIRQMRFEMNPGCDHLECIPGVGLVGITFSVKEKTPTTCIGGVLPEKKALPKYGVNDIFLIQFEPGAFKKLTGVPADEIPPEGIMLDTVFPWASRFAEQMNAVDSETEQIRLVQLFVEECKKRRIRTSGTEELLASHIADYMMQNRRIVRMKELEEYFVYSARTIQKVMVKNVGISPKQMNQQICLQSALRMMNQGNEKSLTEISYQLGYYDQSHFIRTFRKMTGCSPKEYLGKTAMDVRAPEEKQK